MSPLLVLIVAVLATSYAGPIVRFAAAPALAIAFWRLALVLPVTGGLAVLEGSREQGAASSVTRQRLLPVPPDDIVRSTPGAAFLVLDRVAPVHHRRQLGRPRVAQARLRLGHRGGLAARASDARRSLGYRTRRDRGEPHRSGRRAPLVRRPGGRRPRAARRTHRRGLLRDWAARSSNRRDLALRDRRVRGGRRGARPARAGPQHAAGGVRGTRLDGVRCDGCGTDADRPHWNELRAAPLPRHDGERCGAWGTGGGERDCLVGSFHPRSATAGSVARGDSRAAGNRPVCEDGKVNAERGGRNAEQQGEPHSVGDLPFQFRVPHFAFRITRGRGWEGIDAS